MKLHLPKALLAAVVAAFMVPAAYAYTLNLGDHNILSNDETINDTQPDPNNPAALTGDVTLNGHGWDTPAGHSLTLESGANVTIIGNLYVVSRCHLKINKGASLTTTGTLSIGHNEAGNPADLAMTDGELSISEFCFNGNNANAVTIEGGTLTITGERLSLMSAATATPPP